MAEKRLHVVKAFFRQPRRGVLIVHRPGDVIPIERAHELGMVAPPAPPEDAKPYEKKPASRPSSPKKPASKRGPKSSK